jgi:hypothetical protein
VLDISLRRRRRFNHVCAVNGRFDIVSSTHNITGNNVQCRVGKFIKRCSGQNGKYRLNQV